MKAATAKKKSTARQSANGALAQHPVSRIEAGLKYRELEKLREDLGLPLEKLSETLGISRATLHRRKLAGRLAPDESDRVVRFERLVEKAERVLGNRDNARQWLNYPQYGLGGAIPLQYARTEAGAREVEHLLGRIEWGIPT
ncbi:MAG TPA: antitoxin Xre/MbcA/ParS toxin-binding domain-containing protein [Chthoniobacterales bacterium]|nr:antitoxin Xre/MbcA/ParS toxin-binding domain-containing protein [Chthoniobacterales bacterium]